MCFGRPHFMLVVFFSSGWWVCLCGERAYGSVWKKMARVLQISCWNSHYWTFAMASSGQLKVQWRKNILFLLIEPNNNGNLTNDSLSPSALGNLSMLWSLSTVNRFVDGDCWYTIWYFVSINVICADNEHDIPKWHWLNPESEKEDNKNRFQVYAIKNNKNETQR